MFSFLTVVLLLNTVFLRAETSEAGNLSRAVLALEEKEIPFETRSLLADYGGFGSSLLVRKTTESADDSGDVSSTFVLAVPLEADFAVDTALVLAERIQNSNASANILVAFLGDENNELPPEMGGVSHKGLRDLLSIVDMPENWVLCYLDAAEVPEELVVRHGIRGYIAPLDILKPLTGLFASRGIPWSFRIRYNEIYKLGLVNGPETLFIARDEEINAFVLSGGETPPWIFDDAAGTGGAISSQNLAELFFNYAETLEYPVLETDRHYSVIPLSGGRVFFLAEGIIARLLLAAFSVLLFIFLVYSVRHNILLLFHIRVFLRHSWIFLIFLPLMVLSIKVSGLLYSWFFGIFRSNAENILPLWPNYLGAGLTALLAALFFFLPSPALALVQFPRRARFYGFSSVIFITLGLFVAAFLDFSYVPVFLWAFFFVVLGASFTSPVLILLCILLVPLFIVGVLINIFETRSVRITELFISSVWTTPAAWFAALQFALLSLPIILMAKRGTILIQKAMRRGLELKPNRKYRLIVLPVLIAAVAGGMILQIHFIPKIQHPPERRIIDEDARVQNDAVLNLSFDDIVFQDSRIITVRIEGRGNPIRFDLELESASAEALLPVYSAPVPSERGDGGRTIHFYPGEHPPNPLVMEIVVPLRFEGRLKAAAVYNSWQSEVDAGNKPETDDYILKVTKSADLTL